tara:strand:+ start:554 stop:1180 length:627 start_codon:yes stop_codon:yes gene_type:complete
LSVKIELIFIKENQDIETMKVAVNEFVKRQVKGSGKTYSKTLRFEEIAEHAQSQMEKGEFSEGYREGVRIVHADREIVREFVCPFVKIDEKTELISQVVRRRPEEEPYIQTRTKTGKPLKASAVDLILYRHDVLTENDEQSTEADWELISMNAIPEGVDKLPMGPVTMMRNQLKLPGGTEAFYTSEEWAESVQFWQEFAALEPENETR